MSIARQVKSNINIDRMAAAARAMGFTVEFNAKCYGYWSEPMENGKNFPLVIRGQKGYGGTSSTRFDIGVTEDGITADFHGGYVDNTLKKVLPEYYTSAAADAGFQVLDQTETKDEIILRITR